MTKLHIAMYLGRKSENPKTTLLDRVICLFTGSRYSHAELVFRYSNSFNAGVSWSSSPRDGGIRQAIISYSEPRWELYEIEVDSPQEAEQWFLDRNGSKYDYLGAVGVVFPFLRGKIGRWYCFEAIAESLGLPSRRLDGDDFLSLFPVRVRIEK